VPASEFFCAEARKRFLEEQMAASSLEHGGGRNA
jgi:hypothetical protein